MASPPLQAVVFDFDGLIMDSETPIFVASAAAVAALGHELTIEAWATVVGHGEADSFRALQAAVRAPLDRPSYDAAYARQDRSWRDTLPVLDGVVALLDELRDAGVPCAVASSSSVDWVGGHLERLGLRSRFASLATSDRVGGRSKPAPDTYLLACSDLVVDPRFAVALEDSGPGVAAARAAGLNVIAVPSAITRHTDLSDADRSVSSLAELTLADLRSLVADRPSPPPDDAS